MIRWLICLHPVDTGAGRRAGRQAVVDDNDRPTSETRHRLTVPVSIGLLAGGLSFGPPLAVEVLPVDPALFDHLFVELDGTVVGYGTQRELRVVRVGNLLAHHDIEWCIERVGDRPAQRQTATRDREDNIGLDVLLVEGLIELPTGGGSIRES